MTQGESRIPQPIRRPGGVAPLRLPLLFIFCAISCASANEFTRSDDLRVAAPVRCEGGDPDPAASGDVGNCVRITGYVAAGRISATSDGISRRPTPFGAVGAPQVLTGLGASAVTIVDKPAGARPTFLETTHNE
jgi:hypothetical protein